ncbi:MAG TPA: M20 family metallopeptidase [Gemmatimonadaceae bacterium]|nr:M20 family metallopeptidase [Gemmatimonadaceae bacterium]
MAVLEAPAEVISRFLPRELEALLELRRDLHAHPELSWKEERTADKLERALTALGARDVTRVAGTGVVGRLPGREPGAPTVALRGDIDALPIHEDTGLPFASAVHGVMHACGHDVHATWTIGAGMLLSREPALGDVVLVLQPAEELGAGARALIEAGVLDEVSAIFGGHVDRRFEVGQIVADAGPLAASADDFRIELVGQGAHGARPHEAADPVVGAAALVMALQTIVSRRVDPSDPAVVSVGHIHAGTASNVIPDRAFLTGTMRATTPRTRELLRAEVRRLAESVAATHRLTASVTIGDGTPPVVNDPAASAIARAAAVSLVGERNVVPFGLTNMGGEDFAFYQERVPGCFLRVGAREPGGERTPAHSSRFTVAEGAIFVGAAVLAECARQATDDRGAWSGERAAGR